jgi:hypothetical protein
MTPHHGSTPSSDKLHLEEDAATGGRFSKKTSEERIAPVRRFLKEKGTHSIT